MPVREACSEVRQDRGAALYCRYSKRETIIRYAAAAGYQQMLEFARQQRPPARSSSRGAKLGVSRGGRLKSWTSPRMDIDEDAAERWNAPHVVRGIEARGSPSPSK